MLTMTSISFGNKNSGLQAGIVNGPVNAQFYLPGGRFHKALEMRAG